MVKTFGDDGYEKMFIYQVTLDTLELKKDIDCVPSWKSKRCIFLNLRYCLPLSCTE